jgi:hypothetical protein
LSLADSLFMKWFEKTYRIFLARFSKHFHPSIDIL